MAYSVCDVMALQLVVETEIFYCEQQNDDNSNNKNNKNLK